jgi:serine protease Do
MVDWRMRYFLALLLLLSPLAISQSRGDASDIAAATRSVVRIAVFSSSDGQRTLIGYGSGVAVASDKIITNAHVAEPARTDESVTFTIIPSEGNTTYSARLIASAPGKDLALLQLAENGRLIPASFFSGIIGDGADVFAIGYPANVDIALEQSEADVLRPSPPVKTRGNISSGRSSKSVESLLHTAPIAPGSSGGPLADSCGRVIGINSFGSVADGGGAEFYFAISVREVITFLQSRDVNLAAVTNECRSVAELTRAEAEREAAMRAKVEAEARIASELNRSREGKVRSDAEHAVIGERENHLAFATFLLVFSAVAGGAAWQFAERAQRDRFKIAAGVGSFAFIAAVIVFFARPSFDEVDERVRAAMTRNVKDGLATNDKALSANDGERRCILEPERSRVTVSDTADVTFTWNKNGCINGRTQYVDNAGTWSRTFVPNTDAQVSVVSYEPDTELYRIDRYLLGLDAMDKARLARQRYEVTKCSSDPDTAGKIDNMNKAVREVLSSSPNEILVFDCSRK